jgi:hypothetical protein
MAYNQDLYQDLNQVDKEIRILDLHQIDTDAYIRCTLRTVSLKSCPPFKALSYVWGDPSDTCLITLDGKEFQVTKNLALALEYARDELVRKGTESVAL